MNLRIIGLSGKAGSGKDFIGDNYLKPKGYYQFSLAWHLKVNTIGKGLASFNEVFHTKPPTVRKILQEEGTERGRDIYGLNLWCNTLEAWFHILQEKWGIDKFYIPDVRFPNEVEFIQNRLGGQVWRLIAPQREELSGLSEEARKHSSETALDDYPRFKYKGYYATGTNPGFDAVVFNNPGRDVIRQIEVLLSNDSN